MSFDRASSLALAFCSLALFSGCAVATDESDPQVEVADAEDVGEASQGVGGVIPGPPQPFVNKLLGKTLFIVSRDTDKCLEIPNANYTSGQNVQMRTCDGSDRQKFVVQAIPPLPGRNTTGHLIKPAVATNLCLDIEWATSNGGERLQAYGCHYGNNQAFFLDGPNNAIRPRYNNLCLDVVAASWLDGAEVQQFGCHNGHNQDWLYWDVAAGAYIF